MRFMKRTVGYSWGCVLVLFFMLAIAPASAQTSLERLVERAKKEGKIMVYGSYTYDEGNEIHAAFNKRYPFIKFEHLTLGAGDLVTRVFMEGKSGATGADIALTTGALPLFKEGFLLPVDWASLGVRKEVIEAPLGVTFATISYVLAWNTKLVSRASAPKNWDDMLDPKWKGKIGLWLNPNPFVDMIPVWGEKRVTDYLKRLVQNEPVIIRGGSEIPSRLAAGEISVALVIDATLKRVVEKGAPIEWVWPDPVPLERYNANVLKLARNPNAATLYGIWISTREGAEAYEKATGRGNVFVPETPIAQHTKGKRYSFLPTDSEERAPAVKRLTAVIAP